MGQVEGDEGEGNPLFNFREEVINQVTINLQGQGGRDIFHFPVIEGRKLLVPPRHLNFTLVRPPVELGPSIHSLLNKKISSNSVKRICFSCSLKRQRPL